VPDTPWPVLDLDLTAGPVAVPECAPGAGAGVLFRCGTLPVGFVLSDGPFVARGDAWRLADALPDEASCVVIEACLRRELGLAPAAATGCRVTIAICTRDRPEWLRRLLASLAELDPAAPAALAGLETLVVDNAPADDRTRRVVAGFPQVRYVVEPRPGLNFGRNTALRLAHGDLVAYLDDDVVADRGWLTGLLSAWESDPHAGFITGQVLPLELQTQAQRVFERRGGFRRGFRRIHYTHSGVNDRFYPCGAGVFGTGANMAVNRAAALAIGGFDEALDTGRDLPGGGDLDLYYRSVRAGYRATYEPTCVVFHQHRREMPALRRQYGDSWGRAYMAFAAKSMTHDPTMRRVWLWHVAWWFSKQLADLLRPAAGRPRRPAAMIMAETWGGVLGLAGAYRRSCARVASIRERHD
jgi:GT2 family glycosyltransferase